MNPSDPFDPEVETPGLQKKGQDLIQQTTDYVRANPIPSLIGAVAVGFAIGLIARSLEKEREPEPLHDALNEIRALLSPLAKKAGKAYSTSAGTVRDAVEQAMERAKDLDVDRYVDPVSGWWKRLWS